MKIIPYNAEDASEVSLFFRKIFAELGWEERPSDYMDDPDLLFHLPNDGALLLVKEEDHIIGTAGIIKLGKGVALIKRFYIDNEHRGSGIAQELLKELTLKAKSLGIKKFILDVSKNNTRAIRFYKNRGFLPTEVTFKRMA